MKPYENLWSLVKPFGTLRNLAEPRSTFPVSKSFMEPFRSLRGTLAEPWRNLGAPLAGSSAGELGVGFRYSFQIPPGRYDIRVDDRVRVRGSGRESLGVVLGFDRRLGVVQALVLDWLGERVSGPEL